MAAQHTLEVHRHHILDTSSWSSSPNVVVVLAGVAEAVRGGGTAVGASFFSTSDDDTEVDDEAVNGLGTDSSVFSRCAGRSVGTLSAGPGSSMTALWTGAGAASMVSSSILSLGLAL